MFQVLPSFLDTILFASFLRCFKTKDISSNYREVIIIPFGDFFANSYFLTILYFIAKVLESLYLNVMSHSDDPKRLCLFLISYSPWGLTKGNGPDMQLLNLVYRANGYG